MNSLHIHLPDWSAPERALGLSAPFATWRVADRSIFCAWLDHALENKYGDVAFHPSAPFSLPAEIEAHACLFPTPYAFEPVHEGAPDPSWVSVEALDGMRLLAPPTEWELVERHRELTHHRLNRIWTHEQGAPSQAIGRFSRIEPGVQLTAPYWIGENTFIGAGCVIGPHTVIGDGCVIERGTVLRDTQIESGLFVGAGLILESFLLQGGVMLNRQRRILHREPDPLIAKPLRRRALVTTF